MSGLGCPDVGTEDGVCPGVLELPAQLRCPAVLGRQNRIRLLGELRPDSSGERLVVGVECQDGMTWAILWEPGATYVQPFG
ncbi:hypothetical protein OHA79_42030 [Streptomyces sp. NBC_00841]|uniref:hypothetical protein n=1 Tax=Streptomyces sp. NBC_00841 TaxID=2975847 RepID=UPI002DD8D6E0|nr:hypothetical protein [Streptomyces sp. NBC_00841]WSA03813.1 hypothetical protein OHA79_42030 [Streptomyces sp. NBC_00841]